MFKKATNFLTIFTVALFSLMVSSCSDNEEDKTLSEDIVGTWVETHRTWWEKENGQMVDEGDMNVTRGYTYIFYSDGRFSENEYGYYTETGDWKISDGKLKLYYDNDDQDRINLQIDGNSMIWTASGRFTDEGIKYEYYHELQFTRLVED